MRSLLPALLLLLSLSLGTLHAADRPPNIVVVLADQWRSQAFGFAGDPNVKTPHFDQLAGQSTRFINAVAGMCVCSPTRASLLTGQRPITHGVFINDVPLDPAATTLPKVLKASGYDTGAIGKWHVDGHGRSSFIPMERRQGFDYWKVLECTHNYNASPYYTNEDAEKHVWSGYDAVEQTHDACNYLKQHVKSPKPFDESVRVPLLFRWPKGLGTTAKTLDAPINSEDIMPTLLGIAGAAIPKTVEGLDYSGYLHGKDSPGDDGTVITCVAPFGEYERLKGGKEYRGIRTTHYTFVRDLNGPWLLFDNDADPYQQKNLVGDPAHAQLQARLDAQLQRKLKANGDAFLPGNDYIQQRGYKVTARGTMPYTQ